MLEDVDVKNILYDLSRLIDIHSVRAGSTKRIDNQTSIRVKVEKAFNPKGHDYVVLRVKLTPIDTSFKGWNQIVVVDSTRFDNVDALDDATIARQIDADMDRALLKMNMIHDEQFNYSFIANSIPILEKMIEKRETLAKQIRLVISTQLTPQLKENLIEPNIDEIRATSKAFYVNLLNAKLSLKSFAQENEENSYIDFDAELVDKKHEPMNIKRHLDIPISYYDYSDLYWIYENNSTFQENKDKLLDVEGVLKSAIKFLTSSKEEQTYEDVKFYIGEFTNFAATQTFLLNDNGKGDVIQNFISLATLDVFSGLLLELKQSDISYQILEAELVSTKTRSQRFTLLIGPGGMAVKNGKPVYNPRSSDYGSLLKARKLLEQYVDWGKYNEKIKMLTAIFDGRQSNSTLVKKAEQLQAREEKQERDEVQ